MLQEPIERPIYGQPRCGALGQLVFEHMDLPINNIA